MSNLFKCELEFIKMFFYLGLFNLFTLTLTVQLKDFNTKMDTLFQAEVDPAWWENLAKTELFESYHRVHNLKKAYNVILFVGGGMGVTTITPTRILKGQIANNTGEDSKLIFETFPNMCLLKTYTVDNQVPDSEGAATALLAGVKTNNGVIGVNAKVKRGEANCETVRKNVVTSIFDHAHEAGMATGIVTNTRLTEGIAAAAYASVADSDWETSIPPKFAKYPNNQDCADIGKQLIEYHPGRNLNVILGTGGLYFYPKNYTDPITGKPGMREDGLNLVQKWIDHRKEAGISPDRYKFINNRDSLIQTAELKDPTEYLFGAFSELNFDLERDSRKEPSLAEMTEAAINVLIKKEQGFLLLVENGLIDMAHHENYANMAIHETLAFERAIKRAVSLVSPEDTLIIVTGDHSQALTMNGYPSRGHNIMGVAGRDDEISKGYTTLMYSNGPGHRKNRADPNTVDTSAPRYRSHAAVYLESSYHTGDDVVLYAMGPMSHIFHGTKEQTFVAHAMAFAACIGKYQQYDHCVRNAKLRTSSSSPQHISILILILNFSVFLFKVIKI